MNQIIKKPSAWVPIALSLITLVMILVYIATVDIANPPEADEGIPAHLFQIWLVIEFFMLAFFAIKWLPQNPKSAFFVLALQIVMVLIPMSIVFSLGL